MIIAEVVGNIVSTVKNSKIESSKLLIVQPLTIDGKAKGEPLVAVDSVNAGPGDRVIVVLEGRAASKAINTTLAPVEAACVGVVDEIQITG
ncbi:MAG: EutN/CcmL family microcompartment protein [Acidobacteria bacterium]|nr:EutN/CcmL family microcompartment protein [Acidobacteriota bacterium]